MLTSPPEAIAALLARPVAIFGGGVSGRGVLGLLAEIGAVGRIYDEHSAAGDDHFSVSEASRHGLVVYSPGFPSGHPWLAAARAAGCVCLGELDFASLFWTGEVMAITGTNGKTTLTEFLAEALNRAGRRARVAGNIGFPFSRLVVEFAGGKDIAVCEVSSFQAETLEHLRPTATLWTNFAEDHLERHPSMDAYFSAKWRLVERTPPAAVYAGTSVENFARQSGRSLPDGAAVSTEGQPGHPRLAGTVFADYPQRENFLLALAWWRRNGLAEDGLFSAASAFRLGAHRLQRVGVRRGVTFWNDSKATNFHAVEAALATFVRPILWIGGGKSKGGDLAAFVRRIAGKIRHAFLIGETGDILFDLCEKIGLASTRCLTLAEAVESAVGQARAGDHVVLSPGFASFDMFRGYDDRGQQFETIVEKM